MPKPDTHIEAAESGLFWFTRWNGGVVMWPTLREAQLDAFRECERVLNEKESITGIRLLIFRGKIGVSLVEIHENLNNETEAHFVWSPPASDELNNISPEECAHLRRRRASMQEAKK